MSMYYPSNKRFYQSPSYGGSGFGGGFTNRVSVGRKYVFSRVPRQGFYPKQTRVGLRYVKRRTY